MITEAEILEKIDDYSLDQFGEFLELGHGYSYLIDCRLNVFKGDNDRWAIVFEKLGHNPRAGGIALEICYFGNCLRNLQTYDGQKINIYTVYPIDWYNFNDTDNGLYLKEENKFLVIRGNKITLSHNRQDYLDADIELKEYEPGKISLEEIGRLLITKHRDLLRATDEELYKSIPDDLDKILVIDEWYHKDFYQDSTPSIGDEHLKATYEFNRNLVPGQEYMDYENFAALFRRQEQANKDSDEGQWRENRPSSYETWELLAKVIATGDPTLYKPTLAPNTHWKNWPDSGSL